MTLSHSTSASAKSRRSVAAAARAERTPNSLLSICCDQVKLGVPSRISTSESATRRLDCFEDFRSPTITEIPQLGCGKALE